MAGIFSAGIWWSWLFASNTPAVRRGTEWRVIQLGRNAQGDKSVKTDFRTSRCGIVEFVELLFYKHRGQ